MKTIVKFLSVLVGLSLFSQTVDARGQARGGSRGGGGGAHRAAQVHRSPATGSRVQRPASRPAPRPAAKVSRPASRPQAKPVSRPQPKPAARPQPKPVTRPSVQRPTTKPATKPDLNRPATKPGQLPSKKPDLNRPASRPGQLPNKKPDLNRPATKPGQLPNKNPNLNRPGAKPGQLPNKRPGGKPGGPQANRPGTNRPSTLPGMVTYPNRPGKDKPGAGRPILPDRNRPGIGNGNNNRANIGSGNNNRLNVAKGGNRNNVHIGNVNVGRRNVGLNRPSNMPAANRKWNSNKWGGNTGVWGNKVNINNNVKINNNFRNNYNYAYRPNSWGARPWWGANSVHSWHHGSWGYGWNSGYYHNRWYFNNNDNFAAGFMWGITVWSLGNLVYDMGYNTYRNPYPAPPVVYGDAKESISYVQPVSVIAAENPPGDEEVAKIAETKSADAVARSRTAFKGGDYVTSMSAVDEALGFTPGDVTLHEYRALVFFALGKYTEAAGILNAVLASGPGWGWDTMVGFYDASSTYSDQLRTLEAYVKGTPDSAEGHFLLGYHYMVCGYMDKAYDQFAKTCELQPADSIARQLRDLTKSSLPDDGDADAEAPVAPAPVPAEKLVGTWISDRGADGKVTFAMSEDGNYTWTYMNGDQKTELAGTYGLDEQGLLVLTSEDSQMVSEVTLHDDKQMKFVLIGAPEGDPGLEFTKG